MKTGGKGIELRLASIDSVNDNGQSPAPAAFISALAEVSGGRIKATVHEQFEDGRVDAETDLVKAVAAGEIDGGWPVSRAFARAGIHGLEPIEAPFVLTSYAAQRELVSGPGSATLLNTLRGTGVVGLGLAMGPLRRPWATGGPLLDLPSWRGVTIRSFNSPVQEDTERALGAKPVPASFDFPDLVASGKLRAAEFDVPQYQVNEYQANGYGDLLPWVTENEVLWPRMQVLVLSKKRFDSLSAQQQGWVEQAGRMAVQASLSFRYDESTPARQLCDQGVHFVDASARQVRQLRQAVRPVIAKMAEDPVTAPSLEAVQKAASQHPGPDKLDIPASCRKSRG